MVVQPKSIGGIVEVFEKVITSSKGDLEAKGRNSRSIVEREFSEHLVFNSYLSEIKSIL